MNEREKREVEQDVYVSLRDHFNALRIEQDRRIEQAFIAAREAVDKAEKAQERRLDLLNEFRAQSADEGARYAQKEVVEPAITSLQTQVARLYGGLAVVALIGLTNLVRIFFGG